MFLKKIHFKAIILLAVSICSWGISSIFLVSLFFYTDFPFPGVVEVGRISHLVSKTSKAVKYDRRTWCEQISNSSAKILISIMVVALVSLQVENWLSVVLIYVGLKLLLTQFVLSLSAPSSCICWVKTDAWLNPFLIFRICQQFCKYEHILYTNISYITLF